jgi:hypothetical protein
VSTSDTSRTTLTNAGVLSNHELGALIELCQERTSRYGAEYEGVQLDQLGDKLRQALRSVVPE